MNAQNITFSANEQVLTKTDDLLDFASNTVSYIEATFTLGTNWTGFDSVRAVWKSDYHTIATVLDANHKCVVPSEILMYRSKVYVNLVGSIAENNVLTDRLTTFPVQALVVTQNAEVNGTETAPVTPSQFEQFVEAVQDAAGSISDYSYDSEAWAVGKRGGVDVPNTDQTYHNNSKYWAEQNAGLSDEVADLKEDLDETVLDKYTLIQPTNRLNLNTITDDKILLADGTEVNSSSHCYSDYISCNTGDVVYLRYNGYLEAYRRSITCYDSSKEVLPSKGSDETSLSPFTIPSGVSFFRITMSKSDKTHNVVTINQTVNSYVAYEPPYYKITEDFLTEETMAIIGGIGANNHGCSLPKQRLRMTVGISEKWYKSSMVTPPTDFVNVDAGYGYSANENDGVTFPNTTSLDSEIYFKWQHYNSSLAWLSDQGVDTQYGLARKIISENLSNCSLLVIGDSTVDHDKMTETMLNYFSSKGKTLTLLGTLGDGTPNNHNEGRAGWKATDYLTNKQYNGVVNPFYNPSTQTFDFTYYMANQGYTAPDFVVIQLGINDLYYNYASAINTTWNAVKAIIDSIIAYNSSIKIFMNLPTPPNADDSKLSNVGFLYRNAVIKYAELAINQIQSLYGGSKVRPTYCHLILNPDVDIRDDVHPTNDGYAKMGMEVINQINCWQNGV